MFFVLILLVKSLLGSCGNEACGANDQSACGGKSGCQWNDRSAGECRDKKETECVTLAEAGCAAGSGCEWISTASCVRKTEPNCDVLNDGVCAAGCTQDGMIDACVANDDKCKVLGSTYGEKMCTSSVTVDGMCGLLNSGNCGSQPYCELQSGVCKAATSTLNMVCGYFTSPSTCATMGGICKMEGGSCVFDSSYSSPTPSCKWESNTCKFDSSKGACITKPGGGCTDGSSVQCDLEKVPYCLASNCENNTGDTACSSTSEPFCEWKDSYCRPDSRLSCFSSSRPCSSSDVTAGCVSTEASEASCSAVPNLDCGSKSTQPVCEASGCKWTPEDKSLVVYAPLLLIVLSLLMWL